MQNKSINKIIFITIGFALGFLIALYVINIYYHTSCFFQINIYNIIHLTILMVASIYFAYFLTQKRNDERNLKNRTEKLIDKLQNILESKKNTFFNDLNKLEDDNSKKNVLLFLKTINYQISLLNKVAEKINLSSEVKDLHTNFRSFKELITGDEWSVVNVLTEEKKISIDKEYNIISNKLDDIGVELFMK